MIWYMEIYVITDVDCKNYEDYLINEDDYDFFEDNFTGMVDCVREIHTESNELEEVAIIEGASAKSSIAVKLGRRRR